MGDWLEGICNLFQKEIELYGNLLTLELEKRKAVNSADGRVLQEITQRSYHFMVEASELERLRISEGFVPDAIIIDHADNIQSSSKYKDKRHELNNIWSELSTLSKHGYLIWTASQTNRAGWNKEWITTDMIGEDAGKLMICDGVVLINQWKSDTVDEYYWNTQRLRAAYFRGQKLPSFDLKVIHDFSRYIACLDCAVFR